MNLPGEMRIMVVAAGSGGHIFPAVAFCEELKERRQGALDIVFVTGGRRTQTAPVPQGFNPIVIGYTRSILGVFLLGCVSLRLLWRLKPDLVFGFGGFFSVPFLAAAKLFGRKAFIHEQNVVPGRANRFASLFVDRVAISFKESERYLKFSKRKLCLTRYPLRRSLKRVERREALDFFGFREGYFTLLVAGGSQGARRLNGKFLEALGVNKNLSRLQVIHLTGPADFEKVREAYRRLAVMSKVFAFLDEMNYAYSIADLVISRAGAGCVNEIIRFGLPSILVPYPYAGEHQKENARVLAGRGAAILLEDAKMSSTLFNGLLDIFIDDNMRRRTMGRLTASVGEASENLTLADIVLSSRLAGDHGHSPWENAGSF